MPFVITSVFRCQESGASSIHPPPLPRLVGHQANMEARHSDRTDEDLFYVATSVQEL